MKHIYESLERYYRFMDRNINIYNILVGTAILYFVVPYIGINNLSLAEYFCLGFLWEFSHMKREPPKQVKGVKQ